MEASELRIGNWICNQIHGVGFIEAISGLSVLYSRNYDSIPIEQFEPISLTEELLTEFGFYDYGYGRWGCGDFKLLKAESDNGEWMLDAVGIEPHIKHVHQLQNLYFALTEKEL